MKLDFRRAKVDDAGLLVDLYDASFFSDYLRSIAVMLFKFEKFDSESKIHIEKLTI